MCNPSFGEGRIDWRRLCAFFQQLFVPFFNVVNYKPDVIQSFACYMWNVKVRAFGISV
jgi:hypothetical protein